MRRKAAIALLLSTLFLAGADTAVRLTEHRAAPGSEAVKVEKVVVLAILDDEEIRHRVENRFVSLLRGRGIQGLASYRLAPDLATIDDERERDRILATLAEKGIDGAISLRFVSLEDLPPDQWIEQWERGLDARDQRLRDLIRESLPTATAKLNRVGVEVTLWSGPERLRSWSGRTDAVKLGQLRKDAVDFVAHVMQVLKDDGRV